MAKIDAIKPQVTLFISIFMLFLSTAVAIIGYIFANHRDLTLAETIVAAVGFILNAFVVGVFGRILATKIKQLEVL